MRLIVLLLAGLVATSVATGPPRVYAHAEYDRSQPPADGRVQRAPARVDVWFTQPLFRRASANTLVVTDSSGARVDTGDVVLDDGDRTHMSVGRRPGLPDGAYIVGWTSLSATDGDTAEGTFTFTVDSSAPSPSTPTPTAPMHSEPPMDSIVHGHGDGISIPWWALIGTVAILASGGIGGWALFGREPE